MSLGVVVKTVIRNRKQKRYVRHQGITFYCLRGVRVSEFVLQVITTPVPHLSRKYSAMSSPKSRARNLYSVPLIGLVTNEIRRGRHSSSLCAADTGRRGGCNRP
jgi:hypothetical protein